MLRAIIFSLLTFVLAAVIGCDSSIKSSEPLVEMPTLAEGAVNINLQKKAEDIIRTGLTDDNSYIRTNAIEVVASIKLSEFMPRVQELLADEKVPVRFAAAMAIGDTKYPVASEQLNEMLSDENPNVQIAALYALIKIGAQLSDEPIYQSLKEKDVTLQANAAMILGKLGDKKALPILSEVLKTPQNDEKFLFAAVEAMAMLKDEKAYPKLWTMLINTYADDRVMGIRGMGALGTIPARNALITMLDDQILEVRLAAAEQLGAMGDKSGEPEVLDFFESSKITDSERSSGRAKALAALAIGRIDTPALTKHLPKLLDDNSRAVQLAAAKAVYLLAQ